MPKRRIANDPTKKMTVDERDDDWCLEYLPFTRSEIKEIAYVLQIPSSFAMASNTQLMMLLLLCYSGFLHLSG